MLSQAALTLALATASSAHFILQWPPTAGFNDEMEATAPCGAATVNVDDSAPEVQIDRFAIQIQSGHPAGSWQFRGTLDTEEPYSWTDLTPMINTTGVGQFCLNYMSAPEDFAGKPGIIQITDNSADGTLYQCAPVNFVTGANSTLGDACTNQTSSFTATWGTTMNQASDESDGASSSMSPGMTMSTTTQMPEATGPGGEGVSLTDEGRAAAATVAVGGILGGLGAIAAGLVL